MIHSFFTIGSKANRPNRFYRETMEQSEPPNSKDMKPIERMKDPGYNIGRIETRLLNAMEKFGLKISNWKNTQWEWVVILNADGNLNSYLSTDKWGEEEITGPIQIDKWTKELKRYSLKQDGWNNPDAPLRIMSVNHNGTTNYLTFEKKWPQEKQTDTLVKPTEKWTDITLDSGKTVQLLQDSSNNTYDNYSALIIDGKRYEVVEGSISRARDGWTTKSRFQADWKTVELYQPTPFNKGAKATITQK